MVRLIRPEFDGFAEVRHGPVQVAFGFLRIAAIVEGNRIIRLELDGFAQVRDGPVEVAFVLLRIAAIVVPEKKSA